MLAPSGGKLSNGRTTIILSLVSVYLFLLTLLVPESRAEVFTNSWAVHIPGGIDKAKQVVERHGFTFIEEVRFNSQFKLAFSASGQIKQQNNACFLIIIAI